MPELIGYCMKCKLKKPMENVKYEKMGKKKDRDAARGKCSKCATNMYKILSADDKKNKA
jgi:hypothetical protein